MTSRNSTLRCPASTMYSTAEATNPDMGPPDKFKFSIDIFRPHRVRVYTRRLAGLADIDLDQGVAITAGAGLTSTCGEPDAGLKPQPSQYIRGEGDMAKSAADQAARRLSAEDFPVRRSAVTSNETF